MFNTLIDKFQAWLRNEKRIAPVGCRGRVYTRPGTSGGPMAAVAKFKPVLKLRVFRAATGLWEKVN